MYHTPSIHTQLIPSPESDYRNVKSIILELSQRVCFYFQKEGPCKGLLFPKHNGDVRQCVGLVWTRDKSSIPHTLQPSEKARDTQA